ncbi:hypothetical protein NSQ26_03840 [Bacillus sp. FSL W7-1360]
MNKKIAAMAMCLLIFLSGCTMQEDEKGTAFKLQAVSEHEQGAADGAKDELLEMEEVTSVRGIQFEDQILLAVHVKHGDRLQLQDVRKRGHKQIEKLYPHMKVQISTDKKVYKELEDAEEELKAHQLDTPLLRKKAQEITQHMNMK